MTQQQLDDLAVLKQKEPAKYKAITIASLGFFKDESAVPDFINSLTDYIKDLAATMIDGKVTLKFPIPEEGLQIDTLTKALLEDIQEKTGDPEIITARLKSLVSRTLDALKSATSDFSDENKIVSLEQAHGFYDQLMILKQMAQLADES